MNKLKLLIPALLCIVSGCAGVKQMTPYTEALLAARQIPPGSASDSLKAKIREQMPFEPKTADDFFLYAYAASMNEDYDSAKEHYGKAIELKPGYAEAYYGMGNAYYSEEYDYGLDIAVEYYKKTIELKPGYAYAYSGLAKIYRYFEYHSKDEDMAIEYYKKAIELEPYAGWHDELANIYYSRKDYDKAIEHCRKAIELDSSNYYVWLNSAMGLAYAHRKDFDKAIEYQKKVLELENIDDSHAAAYYGMGLAYAGKKDYGKAIEYYKKSYGLDTTFERLKTALEYFEKKRELDPSFDPAYGEDDYDRQIEYYKKTLALDSNKTETYYGMAFAYYNKKDYGSAVECYKKALELNSDTATVYGNIGLIYYEMKDYGKAIGYMEKRLALEPDSSWPYYITGKAYKSKGDTAIASYYEKIVKGMAYYRRGYLDKAIERYEKAIALKPDYAWAYYNIAPAYEDRSYYKVIEYYEKAAELKPDFAEAYFGIGYNYYILLGFHETADELNKEIGFEFDKTLAEDKAIAALKKAAELKPKFIYAYPSPGDVYYRKGDYGSAIEHWKKQIEAGYDYAEAHYGMGAAYYAKGEHGKAIESFEKTLELNIHNSRGHRELPPPPNAMVYEYIGKVYFYGIKDLDKALEYYRKAIELVPDGYEEAHYNIGEIYREKGDKDLELYYKNIAAELRSIPLPPPPLPPAEETEGGKQE